MTARLPMAACLAVLVTVMAHAPAHAQHWVGADPRGDVTAYSYSPDPPPCGTQSEVDAPDNKANDITRLSVRHTARFVRARIHFAALPRTADHDTVIYLGTGSRRGYEVDVNRWDGRVRVHLLREPPPPEDVDECGRYAYAQSPLSCDRLDGEVRARDDIVRVVVPRACLKHPRWVRAGVESYSFREEAIYSDHWVSPVARRPVWLGPRIRQG